MINILELVLNDFFDSEFKPSGFFVSKDSTFEYFSKNLKNKTSDDSSFGFSKQIIVQRI